MADDGPPRGKQLTDRGRLRHSNSMARVNRRPSGVWVARSDWNVGEASTWAKIPSADGAKGTRVVSEQGRGIVTSPKFTSVGGPNHKDV
jgi:hypothetical protein